MPRTRTRVVGSGFTSLSYQGRPIAFLDRFTDSGQRPIAPPEAVTPLDAKRPVEIATARVLGPGTITATIRETWNEPVWFQLAGLAGTETIVDVYERIAAAPGEVTCQMLIKPPGAPTWRGKVYHGCVVSDIDDGETVEIGALTIARNITIMYTHTTPVRTPATR